MTPLLDVLSEREEAVLLMLAEDHGIREIAHQLGVSARTARRDREQALAKLKVHTTTAAVAIVIRLRAGAA